MFSLRAFCSSDSFLVKPKGSKRLRHKTGGGARVRPRGVECGRHVGMYWTRCVASSVKVHSMQNAERALRPAPWSGYRSGTAETQ